MFWRSAPNRSLRIVRARCSHRPPFVNPLVYCRLAAPVAPIPRFFRRRKDSAAPSHRAGHWPMFACARARCTFCAFCALCTVCSFCAFCLDCPECIESIEYNRYKIYLDITIPLVYHSFPERGSSLAARVVSLGPAAQRFAAANVAARPPAGAAQQGWALGRGSRRPILARGMQRLGASG